MKKKAYTYHHTHWDNEWYFTEQESQVQLVYHMEELFYALDNNLIDYYLIDGKSDSIEDYLAFRPDHKEKLKKYVQEKRVFIGPFYSHLSAFIAPGESIINNLQIGMKIADECGGSSHVAYMPDSFGQVQDYPKIFNGMGIKDYVFRRGMGEVHHLENDFIWKSNDGSEILCDTLQSGYSFAGLAFMQGRLIKNAGLNLDKKGIVDQMHALAERSRLKEGFLLPAGKDNCPVMMNFKDLLKQYNQESDEFEFVETTLEKYMEKLRNADIDFQNYEGELYSTQYHRVHKSIFTARPDIKILQDKIERMLIFEIQPLMTMLDKIGIEYQRELIQSIWKLLVRSQTHSEATNSDITNEQILKRAEKAFMYARAVKVYLTRKIAISVPSKEGLRPIVLFNTLPQKRSMTVKIKVFTKDKNFKLMCEGKDLAYSIVRQDKIYGGWLRKNKELLDHDKDYYLTNAAISIEDFHGFSYTTIFVHDGLAPEQLSSTVYGVNIIENSRYKLDFTQGKFNVFDKKAKQLHEDIVYIEDSGDQGDTFDYDYTDKNIKIITDLKDAKIKDSYKTEKMSAITLEGNLQIPSDLQHREKSISDSTMSYEITFRIRNNSEVIEIFGKINNKALNHRTRIVIKTENQSKYSIAGTQFGYLKRATNPPELKVWKQEKWLEEPDPIEPLLNHVSLTGKEYIATVFTRGPKEYEIIGDGNKDIALTVFRAVGHFGLPDLNRRPGRASGTPERIFEAPISQMLCDNEFAYGLAYYDAFDGNIVMNDYIKYGVDPVYFQNQELNRLFTPMKYFETNKLRKEIPAYYELLELESSEGCFSTLKKCDREEAYILRIYNNENHVVEGGKLNIKFEYKGIYLTDLKEDNLKQASLNIGKINKGEIKTIKIVL